MSGILTGIIGRDMESRREKAMWRQSHIYMEARGLEKANAGLRLQDSGRIAANVTTEW